MKQENITPTVMFNKKQ